MDESGAFYTERSKSGRKILYINVYIYIYMKSRKIVLMKLQGRNRDPDVGNGLVDTSEEGDGGTH